MAKFLIETLFAACLLIVVVWFLISQCSDFAMDYLLRFADLLVGMISSKIIFGIESGYIIIGLSLIVSSIITIVIQLKKKKEVSLKKEAELRCKKQKEEAKHSMEEASKVVQNSSETNWENILIVAKYYDYNSSRYQWMLEKILAISLISTIQISHNKEKIVYGPLFINALMVLDDFAKRSYSDKDLVLLKKQVLDFFEIIKPYQGYQGYKKVKSDVEFYCKNILALKSE